MEALEKTHQGNFPDAEHRINRDEQYEENSERHESVISETEHSSERNFRMRERRKWKGESFQLQ